MCIRDRVIRVALDDFVAGRTTDAPLPPRLVSQLGPEQSSAKIATGFEIEIASQSTFFAVFRPHIDSFAFNSVSS